ncbi:MAG: hypothetical protein LUF92_14025 [Clostridiales bacterium]|nr:hypothetical protein [Clostridiales bacterium]
MIQNDLDVLTDTIKFTEEIRKHFPQNRMQAYMMEILYKMDIVRAIQDAKEIDDPFTRRFTNRLVRDFGAKEEYAKWAVSVWCVSYGERILQKPCSVTVYQVN